MTLILIHYRWWSHNIRSGPDTNFYFSTSNFWQIYLFCYSSSSPPITRAYHHWVASCLRAERQSFSATTHKTPLNRAIISANCDQSFYYSPGNYFRPKQSHAALTAGRKECQVEARFWQLFRHFTLGVKIQIFQSHFHSSLGFSFFFYFN